VLCCVLYCALQYCVAFIATLFTCLYFSLEFNAYCFYLLQNNLVKTGLGWAASLPRFVLTIAGAFVSVASFNHGHRPTADASPAICNHTFAIRHG